MWRDEVEANSHKVNNGKHWALFKRLSGKSTRPPPNQTISFKGKIFNKANDIAQKFCKQFTSTIVHKSDPRAKKVKRSLRAKHKIDTTYKPFTPAVVIYYSL
jgi:hypothetical protein